MVKILGELVACKASNGIIQAHGAFLAGSGWCWHEVGTWGEVLIETKFGCFAFKGELLKARVNVKKSVSIVGNLRGWWTFLKKSLRGSKEYL